MGNCTDKSAAIQKYFKSNHKSTKFAETTIKPPPPLESGLEGSVSNLSISSTPRQTRHKLSDYFKNRRADSLPRHLSHIRTIFKQNSNEEKKIPINMPISKSSPNNFRSNSNTKESRPMSEEISNIREINSNQIQRNSISNRLRQASLRISTPEANMQANKRHSDIINSLQSNNNQFITVNPQPSRIVLIAMFDYHARTNEELSLRKSEKMYLINEFDPDWWLVESVDKGDKGYIPSTFVAVEGSLESRDWFIKNISRKDSERLLLLQCNPQGTFLVRQSETSKGALSLSVRDTEPTGTGSVKHYKIHTNSTQHMPENAANNNSTVTQAQNVTGASVWWISKKAMFPSLDALVTAYSNTTGGSGSGSLCCRLSRACVRPNPVTADLSYRTKGEWWEIPRSQLQLVEKLGSGQFGEVWRALWNNTTWVAVKSLLPQSGMSSEEFLKEARTMKALHHPRLVQLYGVCRDSSANARNSLHMETDNVGDQTVAIKKSLEETGENDNEYEADNALISQSQKPLPLFIVTELMTNGSLLVYLRDGPGMNVDMRILIDLMAQIAHGMSYLEEKGYIHRDLAARNILVGENYSCKVADFGLARMTGGCAGGLYEAKEGTKFPIKWTAPEAASLGRFTIKADVWSFGIVLYEIVTRGKVPYPSMNNVETLAEVEKGYRMPCPKECPNKVYQIMTSTWQKDPENRPTFEYLCQYFENYYVHSETSYKHALTNHNSVINSSSNHNTNQFSHHHSTPSHHHSHHHQPHHPNQRFSSHSFSISPQSHHNHHPQEPELTAL